MYKKNEIKEFINDNNFIPSKKLGQNFLFNIDYQKKIINASNINKDVDVIEIGPGLGAITKHLVNYARKVVAIELDKRLFEYLKNNINSNNLILINNDILKVDLDEVIKKNNLTNIKVVANLPYSISSKIILELLKKNSDIKDIYILVQKEMAERINARVNTKNYNAFTVLVSLFANIKNLFIIPPNNFIPAPKVDSSFIHLSCSNKYNVDFYNISEWLKLCFNQKRKTLLNNLLVKYSKDEILLNLNKLSLNPNIRSEALTKEQLLLLYDSFNN